MSHVHRTILIRLLVPEFSDYHCTTMTTRDVVLISLINVVLTDARKYNLDSIFSLIFDSALSLFTPPPPPSEKKIKQS